MPIVAAIYTSLSEKSCFQTRNNRKIEHKRTILNNVSPFVSMVCDFVDVDDQRLRNAYIDAADSDGITIYMVSKKSYARTC